MSMALAEMRDAVRALLPEGLQDVILDGEIDIWINDGQNKLEYLSYSTTTLTWLTGATSVALPTDLEQMGDLYPSYDLPTVPKFRQWGLTLIFTDDQGAMEDGNARLLYRSRPTRITEDDDSTLPPAGDNACICYAVSRAWKRIASDRVVYRRYSTITGQNNVTSQDLDAIAERYYNDFLDAKDDLPLSPPSTFWAD